ncbi:HD domain-containing protein [Candidatus Woesearchaeota archaeon]|nr:HD domain-containing protein [Candidatus Woesearchaeota archaeon]
MQLSKNYFAKNKPNPKNKQDSHYDIDHALRVAYWAEIISEQEKADKTITIPAALLHDIGIVQRCL